MAEVKGVMPQAHANHGEGNHAVQVSEEMEKK
jgi:hypothetical protein